MSDKLVTVRKAGKRKPPVGSSWRILANDPQGKRVDIHSKDYPRSEDSGARIINHRTVFDELVIDRWFHIEQMSAQIWWVRLGDENRMVTVRPDGRVIVGEMYR